jgi:curved DNA-binding protein CbpA
MKNYYKILGLKEDASAEEIHARWIELMRRFHPDLGSKGKMSDEFVKEINEAYQVLKDAKTRDDYDFQRVHVKDLKKIHIPKAIFPVIGLGLLLIFCFLYLKEQQTPDPLKPKSKSPHSVKDGWVSIPNYEPVPHVSPPQAVSQERTLISSPQAEEKLKSNGKPPAKTGSKLEKPTQAENLDDKPLASVRKELSSKKENTPPIGTTDQVNLSTPRPEGRGLPSTRAQAEGLEVHPEPRLPTPSLKAGLRAAERVKPIQKINQLAGFSQAIQRAEAQSPELKKSQQIRPPLLATEEEVQQFFAHYMERYQQKDMDGFLSLFSPKAIQNQKDGLERIKWIYSNFFNQSESLQYRLEDMKIEIYQNGVEVKARYEVDQILKKGGEKKIWMGHIQWTLIKEGGGIKIISLNYQHQKSP